MPYTIKDYRGCTAGARDRLNMTTVSNIVFGLKLILMKPLNEGVTRKMIENNLHGVYYVLGRHMSSSFGVNGKGHTKPITPNEEQYIILRAILKDYDSCLTFKPSEFSRFLMGIRSRNTLLLLLDVLTTLIPELPNYVRYENQRISVDEARTYLNSFGNSFLDSVCKQLSVNSLI